MVTNHERLINLQFNDDVQAAYEYYYPDELYYNFPDNSTNLNLSTVYFLTTSRTASASELLISGLEPYMDVVQIGEATYGKYTGMYVFPDDNEECVITSYSIHYTKLYENNSGNENRI